MSSCCLAGKKTGTLYCKDDDLKSWVPPSFHSPQNLEKIREQLEENNKPNPAEKVSKNIFKLAGWNFKTIDEIRKIALQEIQQKSVLRKGMRPKVADLGCGRGFMSWKIILAGGECHFFDQNKELVNVARENTQKAKSFLGKEETLETVCFPHYQCIFEMKNDKKFKNKYLITYSGNIIHFYSPKKVKEYLSILFDITEPGGLAFASVHTVLNENPFEVKLKTLKFVKELEAYNDSKSKKAPFPGYMLVNGLKENCVSEGLDFIIGAEPLDIDADRDPILLNRGHYYSTPNKVIDEEPLLRIPISTPDGTKEIDFSAYHCALHFFDKETLEFIFREAGFYIIDCFYMDGFGNKTDNFMESKSVGIKAYKKAYIPICTVFAIRHFL